jgi:acetyl esterase/lipase
VDDELAATVALIPDLSFAELDHTRQTLDALVAALPADLTGVRVEDRRTPGVDVRIFTPEQRSADLAPAVLDIHGGGFAVGPLALDDGPNADLVRATGAVVVSVDYRLAPSTPTRRRPRTVTRRCDGSSRTPRSWAPTRAASRCSATARAAVSPPPRP